VIQPNILRVLAKRGTTYPKLVNC